MGFSGLGAVGFRVFGGFGGFRVSFGFRVVGIGVMAVQVVSL